MPYLPLATKSDLGRWSGERLLNYIPHRTDATGPVALLGRSGISSGAVGSSGVEVRAIGIGRNALIWVAGTTFAVADGTSGTTVSSGGHAWICGDAVKVAGVIGNVYHVYDGSSWSTPSTGAVTTPEGVAYMDGYFLVWGSDGTRNDVVQPSDLDDPTSFTALNFFAAETDSDRIQAIVPGVGGVRIFGSRSIEDWYNAGAAGWLRNSPSGISIGCLEGKTAARHMERFYWVGDDGRVYESEGSIAVPVSTPWVERAVLFSTETQSTPNVFVRSGFIYKDRGHTMYVINREVSGTGAGLTSLAFDIDTREWFEFSTGDSNGSWMVNGSVNLAAGVLEMANPPSGYLWRQYLATTSGVRTIDGHGWLDVAEPIVGEVTSPPINEGGKPMDVGDVRLCIDTDGEVVNVDAEFSRYAGNFGTAKTRAVNTDRREAVWLAQGQFDPGFQVRFTITADERRDIYGVMYG